MKRFFIYHPVNGQMNHSCIIGKYNYELVAVVYAESVHHVFPKSQNDFSEEYRLYKIRSTSVGDIICDLAENTYYLIHGLGMKEVDKQALHAAEPYTMTKEDWQVLGQLVGNQMLENPENYGLV